ncbi:ATP-dependent nuclease [Tumebacillus lipolyticus]|uniref:ATP-dependent endonuclease n=1 Tax=Tumebacillus lipolyticus TaxID=1280370 RepID=A0ABW5A1Y7_9BACL
MLRPRLSKLIIKHFRCIGSTPVVIELDDIVVLVGPNNAGKSSILRAYEVVMSEGSQAGRLTRDDFPNGEITPDTLPEIELHTVVYDDPPGRRWIQIDPQTGEMVVREKWIWPDVGEPVRRGFDVEKGDWAEQVPWGAPNVANARRPQPHRVDAFTNPKEQSDKIMSMLLSVLNERIKQTDYTLLLEKMAEVQKLIVEQSHTQIAAVEAGVSELFSQVFPDYQIRFDARPEDDLDKAIQFFKVPQLLMGPRDGFQSTIDRQGSGARRTMLWAALRYISESGYDKPKARSKKAIDSPTSRPHVLLLDEPELCLHPNAVREACRVLYDLPKTGEWQVMVTTHSPAFLDLSRDNTTIIRVERSTDGTIKGTTLFRPERAQLDEDDKQKLKLLNLCDPHVGEFFFGGSVLVVEGDTEYTAFKHIIAAKPEQFRDVHIIRARGKATIISLIKILNHFGTRYSVLHDSDSPTIVTRTGKEMANPAWAHNIKIYQEVQNHPDPSKVRLLASVPNFESAYFGHDVDGEKPYNALLEMRNRPTSFDNLDHLLQALLNHDLTDLPDNCLEWHSLDQLKEAVIAKKTQSA